MKISKINKFDSATSVAKKILLALLLSLLLASGYFFLGKAPQAKTIEWGVNFSQKHSQNLGLDWRENYLALLEDLGVKNIKLATYWDLLEPKEGEYNFDDLDWQVEAARERESSILLVVGLKTPRWPECHFPGWAEGLSKAEQQERILKLIEKTVLRYRDSDAVTMWQVENEPFFPFGECQWQDKEFLKEEIRLVKSLDSKKRQVLISDSGEGSFWIRAASLGDVVGTTMYRKVWMNPLSMYLEYPLPPVFYWRKALIVKTFFNKEIIVVELQAEPWGPKLLYESSLKEQEKTMDLERFKENVEYAKKTGFDKFYLWGVEWWYWMRVHQDNPEIWQEAKKLF